MVAEDLEFFASFTQEIKHNLNENFNIQSETNWKKNQPNLITVYKLIRLDLDFKEFQNEALFNFCLKLKSHLDRKLFDFRDQEIFDLLLQISFEKN